LGRNTRVDATQDHGERCLAGCGSVDRATEVAAKLFAHAESPVAFHQDVDGLLRREAVAEFAGGEVGELDVVIELVLTAKSSQADGNVVNRCHRIAELANHAQHVRIDVVGTAGIDKHAATSWRFAKYFVKR